MPNDDFIPLEQWEKNDPNFIPLEAAKKKGWLDRPIASPEQYGVKENVAPAYQINTPRDMLLKGLRAADPIITGFGTYGGGTIGAPLGPSGIALGAVLGGTGTSLAMRHAIEAVSGKQEPSLPARLGIVPSGSILDRLMGAFGETATSIGGEKLVNAAINPVFQGMLSSLKFIHPPTPNTSFSNYPDIPASYSQMTGGTGKVIENVFAPGIKETQLKASNQAAKTEAAKLTNKFAGQQGDDFIDLYELLGKFKGNITAAAEDLQSRSNSAAKLAKNIAKLNQIAQQTPMGPIPVNGPTFLNRAIQRADSLLKGFQAKYGIIPEIEMLKIVDAQEKPLLATVHQILRFANKDKAGNLIPDKMGNVSLAVPFEAAWDIKQAAAKLGNYEATFPISKESKFRNLSLATDDDIENSMRGWTNGADIALKSYKQAKAIVKKRHELYQQGDTISKILGGADLDEQMLATITKTPESLGRAIAAGRDRKVIQASEFQRIIQNAWENDGQTFNVKKLLDTWQDPSKQAVYNKLYNAEQRKDINNLITILKDTSQKQSNSGRFSMLYQLGKSGVFVGSGVIGMALSRGGLSPYEVAGMGIVGGTIGLHSFAKNVLLNPKVARQAAFGFKTPQTSDSARLFGNTILGALKGTGILLQKRDGTTVPATIQQDGSIKLDAANPQ